jgi:tRNA G18 (ribose-2'-O)-methylase SpoU
MIALLYNIRSLANVGSIFRTADAAGLKKLYLCGITPAPLDKFNRPRPPLVKVSLGAEKYLDWDNDCRSPRATSNLIKNLKAAGYRIFAIEQAKNSVPFSRVELSKKEAEKICLVVGHEVRGLPRFILDRADKIIEIPMRGKKESLNVAVAFGIVAFSVVR